MKSFISEFKKFILRGNVIDLAVGVIIGGAFQSIVTSLTNDIIMPLITLITGGIDFTNWFVALDGGSYATLAEAQEVGAATLNYGTFITAILNFIIMAFVIFLIVKGINKLNDMKKKEDEAPTTKICYYCKSEISIEATKCPCCTSDLSDVQP